MPSGAVAIIPARGGSKGVPYKNKRIVGGKPLIAYAIDSALAAQAVARVLVTSDDPEILTIACDHGAEAFARPAELAGDASPVIDAVRQVIAAAKAEAAESYALLQPTSPLRTGADIDAAIALHRQTGRPVCSVYSVEDAHPARMYRLEEGLLHPLDPERAAIRRQDLPPVYHRNGAIYVFGPEQVANGRIIDAVMAAYVMAAEVSINIDTELDFAVLKAVLEQTR